MNRSFLSKVFFVAAVSAALLLSTNSAKAVLLNYEGFDYTAGSLTVGTNGPGAEGQGGLGWGTSYWSATPTSLSTNVSGLSYANGGTLLTTGGALQQGNPYGPSTGLAGGANATASSQRSTSTNQFGKIAADNGVTSLWVSFLMQDLQTSANGFLGFRQANLGLFRTATTNANGTSAVNGTEVMAIGSPNSYQAPSGDFLSLWPTPGGSAVALSTGVASPRSGSAAFLLIRIDLDNTTALDSISVWANPSLASEPGTNTAVTINTLDLSSLNAFRFQAGNANGSGTNTSFLADELRFGTTFGDVAPVVPEPGTLAVIGVGLSGLVMVVRRKRS